MGFWQGLNAGFKAVQEEQTRKRERQEDIDLRRAEIEDERNFRREMADKEFMANFRGTVLEVAAKRIEEKKALEKKLDFATSLGLTEDNATALLRSGQLDLFIAQYEKNPKVDPQFISDLNAFLSDKMKDASPKEISGALIAGVTTSRDVTDPAESQNAIVEAVITASTPEQLDDLYVKLLEASNTYTPLPRFDVDFTTLGGAEESETKAIRRELAESLGTYFEGSFTVTDTGDVVVNQSAPPSVRQMFNEAERRARDMAFSPTREFTPTDAARDVATNLEVAIQGTKGMAKAEDILKDFDTVVTNPQAFVRSFLLPPDVTPPPPSVKPEAVVESLGDANMGFGFDLEEEIKKRK